MADDNISRMVKVQQPSQLQSVEPFRIPLYRRDIFPANVVISAEDIRDFCKIVVELNEVAKEIERKNIDMSKFESVEEAYNSIEELMPVEYNYISSNRDSVLGHGIPKIDHIDFPDELYSIFISNASFAQRAINLRPLNTVEIFLCFEKPTLKIDLQTLPSNPTQNSCVINVAGRNEDWVIYAAQKIEIFLNKRKLIRPIIHGSGAYDYFIYLVIFPSLIWVLYKTESYFSVWIESRSIFINLILGIYAFLFSMLLARFVFQYARWLFPPIEYYKKRRIGAFVHRGIAGLVVSAICFGAIYDLLRAVVLWLFS